MGGAYRMAGTALAESPKTLNRYALFTCCSPRSQCAVTFAAYLGSRGTALGSNRAVPTSAEALLVPRPRAGHSAKATAHLQTA